MHFATSRSVRFVFALTGCFGATACGSSGEPASADGLEAATPRDDGGAPARDGDRAATDSGAGPVDGAKGGDSRPAGGDTGHADAAAPADTHVGADSSAPASDVGGPLPTDDLAAAQAFVAPLVLGANVERGFAYDMPGVSPTSSTAYWTYLKDTVGLTHVRMFYPWRPSFEMGGGGPGNAPPDAGRFNRILDAAEQANKAGLKVFLDCTDVMGLEDFTGSNGAATETHIANCARWTADHHMDPTMFALGPVNEWAGGDDNTTFNDHRLHFHGVLRAALPGYVLTTGPGYWKSRDWLYDAARKFTTFDDLRVVYEWHEYSTLDVAGWTSEEAKLDGWRKAHGGRPTICGEAGPGWPDESYGSGKLGDFPAAWIGRYRDLLPAIAADRPSVWAITYGGSLRLNKAGDDPHVMDGTGGEPNFLQTFLDAEAAMKKVLGIP